ncbi:hypothetical protein IE81DRAFT_367351 [Ceraceosorus guamensis]|uniref:Uncharacterized protein n=1 Tax=Ceraceosorus guamensis TaxID=1522189 RepID=A0A316VW63_9BASI|nr:hypothetical protein IE81DRAFT_367351 [Ceraceosorus guamensis]PWN41534.1 hypothetical protein IE81DRAFT_367351 [Ceraceosorus guamensis]
MEPLTFEKRPLAGAKSPSSPISQLPTTSTEGAPKRHLGGEVRRSSFRSAEENEEKHAAVASPVKKSLLSAALLAGPPSTQQRRASGCGILKRAEHFGDEPQKQSSPACTAGTQDAAAHSRHPSRAHFVEPMKPARDGIRQTSLLSPGVQDGLMVNNQRVLPALPARSEDSSGPSNGCKQAEASTTAGTPLLAMQPAVQIEGRQRSLVFCDAPSEAKERAAPRAAAVASRRTSVNKLMSPPAAIEAETSSDDARVQASALTGSDTGDSEDLGSSVEEGHATARSHYSTGLTSQPASGAEAETIDRIHAVQKQRHPCDTSDNELLPAHSLRAPAGSATADTRGIRSDHTQPGPHGPHSTSPSLRFCGAVAAAAARQRTLKFASSPREVAERHRPHRLAPSIPAASSRGGLLLSPRSRPSKISKVRSPSTDEDEAPYVDVIHAAANQRKPVVRVLEPVCQQPTRGEREAHTRGRPRVSTTEEKLSSLASLTKRRVSRGSPAPSALTYQEKAKALRGPHAMGAGSPAPGRRQSHDDSISSGAELAASEEERNLSASEEEEAEYDEDSDDLYSDDDEEGRQDDERVSVREGFAAVTDGRDGQRLAHRSYDDAQLEDSLPLSPEFDVETKSLHSNTDRSHQLGYTSSNHSGVSRPESPANAISAADTPALHLARIPRSYPISPRRSVSSAGPSPTIASTSFGQAAIQSLEEFAPLQAVQNAVVERTSGVEEEHLPPHAPRVASPHVLHFGQLPPHRSLLSGGRASSSHKLPVGSQQRSLSTGTMTRRGVLVASVLSQSPELALRSLDADAVLPLLAFRPEVSALSVNGERLGNAWHRLRHCLDAEGSVSDGDLQRRSRMSPSSAASKLYALASRATSPFAGHRDQTSSRISSTSHFAVSHDAAHSSAALTGAAKDVDLPTHAAFAASSPPSCDFAPPEVMSAPCSPQRRATASLHLALETAPQSAATQAVGSGATRSVRALQRTMTDVHQPHLRHRSFGEKLLETIRHVKDAATGSGSPAVVSTSPLGFAHRHNASEAESTPKDADHHHVSHRLASPPPFALPPPLQDAHALRDIPSRSNALPSPAHRKQTPVQISKPLPSAQARDDAQIVGKRHGEHPRRAEHRKAEARSRRCSSSGGRAPREDAAVAIPDRHKVPSSPPPFPSSAHAQEPLAQKSNARNRSTGTRRRRTADAELEFGWGTCKLGQAGVSDTVHGA